MPPSHELRRAGTTAWVTRLLAAVLCLLSAGCVAVSAADARLTALGRAARPLRGQSLAEHVNDAAECREQVLDRLVQVGGYALFNPLARPGRAAALRAWEERFAQCLRDRGYAPPE